MPDENGDPTDGELTNALGWDSSDGEGEGSDAGDSGLTSPESSEGTFVTAPPEPAPDLNPPRPPITTPPPSQPDPLRQQLEQQNQQLKQQQAMNGINSQAQQYMNNLITQGWDESQAQTAATQYAQSQYQQHQAQEVQQVAETQAKIAKAYELSHAYGVPHEQLLQYNDPYGMEQAARMYQETTGRIRNLEAQVNANNRAPTQAYDSNNMATSNSPQAKKLRYATDPNFKLTDDEFRQLFG